MAAAQRSTSPDELSRDTTLDTPRNTSTTSATASSEAEPDSLPPFALKQQVAERLAAHRARRSVAAAASQAAARTEDLSPAPARGRSAHIAAAVAERYAQSPTYRTFLAAEAERSVRQAEAAADVANINAKAIAVAQQHLLADLEHWDPDPEDFALGPIAVSSPGSYTYLPTSEEITTQALASALSTETPVAASLSRRVHNPSEMPPYTVRPYESGMTTPGLPNRLQDSHTSYPSDFIDDTEGELLDEEIAFRHDPTFDDFIRDPLPISPNLLEFPRQLVAARKARPRIEEGPLREVGQPESPGPLRIFEVTAEGGAVVAHPDLPEWSSILLAAHPHTAPDFNADPHFVPGSHIDAATIPARCMAAIVDASILAGTLAAFLGVVAATVTHLPGNETIQIPLPLAAGSALAVLLLLTVTYFVLFFTVSDATPGMRYARIALCTIHDENPTRSAMRRRLLFTALATLPLGLGLLSALLDDDRLGWHDRLSGMYQRSY